MEVFQLTNEGPISIFTKRFLEEINIPIPDPLKWPDQIAITDFYKAERVILMDIQEQFPLMEKYHPEEARQAEYWDFPDIQFEKAVDILQKLKNKVEEFITEFSIIEIK